jgi:hypothetical protein
MIELLDPRHDAEPAYWAQLRVRAGLHADWDWPVLRAAAWFRRTPLLVSVLRDAGEITGVVCAAWGGLPARRHAFVSPRHARWLGVLDVRAPGNTALPGWWAAAGFPTSELFRRYTTGMRRMLGARCRGVLWRQLSTADVAALPGRVRLVRPTEQVATMHTAGLSTREEWLATLAGKRRRNLRTVFRSVESDPDLEVTVGPGRHADPVAVAEVLRHNEHKYSHRFGPLPQATGYLAVLLDRPDVLVFRYTDRTSGALLAVATLLDHPSWPLGRYWSAVPVERGGRPGLYFHHYGALITWAMVADRKGVVVGKGRPELKASLGARLVEQYAAAVPVR